MTLVQITTENPYYADRDRYDSYIPETHTHVGELLSPLGADPVVLSVPNREIFTERKIVRKRILSCKEYVEPLPPLPTRYTWKVDGHWVIVDHGNWSCSCYPFFRYNKCRHVRRFAGKAS
jgi:hypothetical protein